MHRPGLVVEIGYCLIASLVASLLAFGPFGFFLTPITLLYAMLTALPLYRIISAARPAGWLTAMLVGAACTLPLLAFSLLRLGPWRSAGPDGMQLALFLWHFALPGAAGGLVFHGMLAMATRPRKT